MTSAAWSGDYADFKLIKTRKVFQVVIEMPIEQAAPFVAAFGMPDPSTGVPVALARLTEEPKQPADKTGRSWDDIPKSQQAAMKCNDPDFRRFLALDFDGILMLDLDMAIDEVKRRCGVSSRKDILTDPVATKKWDRLYSDFQIWQRGGIAA